MKKLPDGSYMTYEGLEARNEALTTELAQAQARVTELSDMKPQTMKQRIAELEAALEAAHHWLWDDSGTRLCDERVAEMVKAALAPAPETK